ncbi:MAG: hypothetical protein A2161_13440, partial [Candidatus Schekmanbacteria bacterium RBG_13_48_7]
FQFHFFPLTLGELFCEKIGSRTREKDIMKLPEPDNEEIFTAWETMFNVSSFPEPYLKGQKVFYRRWAQTYHRQIIREDIRDALFTKRIDEIETLYSLLIPRVGSLLSASSLSGQLKVSHNTISSWLRLFENLDLIFRVKPYNRKISRSILKEPKFYFYETGQLEGEGKRFENLVGIELKRAVTLWTDYGLGTFDLRFLRNKDQQEVDFLVTRDETPFFLVEAKLEDTTVSTSLKKFQSFLKIPAIHLVNRKGINRIVRNEDNKILITTAAPWLATLG